MPKVSKKTKLLELWKHIITVDLLSLDTLTNSDDDDEEDDLLDIMILLHIMEDRVRYGVPFIHNSVPKTQEFVNYVLPHLDEGRFIQIVRMSWVNFNILLELIKDNEVFNGPRSCQQLPVDVQLVIVLYRLGSCGEGASVAKISGFFGISDGGLLQIITERIFKAILMLKEKYLFWPSAQERKTLVSETLEKLPHCIGYVDGTEIKLSEKPTQDPEAYFSRKHIYSVKVQAVCDHKLRIRHMVLSWPGSVHDSRIYKSCGLYINPMQFFSDSQWIAGDKAYSLSKTVIVPFRSNSAIFARQQQNAFNLKFSKYRVRIEHVFGRLKERFSSLKELKIRAGSETDIKKINRWIMTCAILHNFLIENNEVDEGDIEYSEDDAEDESGCNTFSTEGESKRQAILELML